MQLMENGLLLVRPLSSTVQLDITALLELKLSVQMVKCVLRVLAVQLLPQQAQSVTKLVFSIKSPALLVTLVLHLPQECKQPLATTPSKALMAAHPPIVTVVIHARLVRSAPCNQLAPPVPTT
jgi:hypothetical protein